MQIFFQTFVRGLLITVPFVLTLYILFWIFNVLEDISQFLILLVLPEQYYYSGIGFALGVVFIFVIGVIANILLFQRVFLYLETMLEKVPLVRTIYSSLKDLLSFFQSSENKLQKTALLQIDELHGSVLGFITQEDPAKLPNVEGFEGEPVAFYVPMSYQIGGFTLLVPKEKLQSIEMGVEEALKFALTAGVARDK